MHHMHNCYTMVCIYNSYFCYLVLLLKQLPSSGFLRTITIQCNVTNVMTTNCSMYMEGIVCLTTNSPRKDMLSSRITLFAKNLLTNLLDQWLLTSFVVPELLKLVQLPTTLLQYVDYKPLPSPSLGLSHTESQVL